MNSSHALEYGIFLFLTLAGLGAFFFLMCVSLVLLVRNEQKRVMIVLRVILAFERRLKLR